MASSRPVANHQPIVGRERERAQLGALLDAAIDGQGSLVLVSGEAGIGKTTLVQDLVRQAREQDVLVLTGGCYDLTKTPPYGPWSEAIRGYAPRDGQPSTPAWFGDPDAMARVGSQTALFEETRRFFAAIAEQQPLVIVLEDLHWADAASLEALRYLARTLDESPILLVVTYRDDEITRRHELYQLLPLLIRESRAERVHLNRIDRDDIRAMIAARYVLEDADLASLVEHVVLRSEGNPFFAEEILQGLEDDQILAQTDDGWTLGSLERVQMPSLLAQTFNVRLARLSDDTRLALAVAAVAGHVIPIDLWQEISGLDEVEFERAMSEAIAARVLAEAPSSNNLQFRHALLREALYESLTLSRRRFWHRKLGETRSEMPNASPGIVAHHFQEAGDPQAVRWLIRAGMWAERSHAVTMAIDYYETAEGLLEQQPEMLRERGWLMFHIGHLLRYVDEERSLAIFTEAEQLDRQGGDPVLRSYCTQRRGMLAIKSTNRADGLRLIGKAVDDFDVVTPEEFERSRAAVFSIFPEFEIANTGTMATLAGFSRQPSPMINVLTDSYVVYLANLGYFHEALERGERYITQVEGAIDDKFTVYGFCCDALKGLALACDALGRPDDARRWRDRALAAFRAYNHDVILVTTLLQQLVHVLTYQPERLGDRAGVAIELAQAVERINQGVTDIYPQELMGVHLLLIDGRWDEAVDAVTAQQHDWVAAFGRMLRVLAYGLIGLERQDQTLIDRAWEALWDALPNGPDTEPELIGGPVVPWVIGGAAQLALETQGLTAARPWLKAHDRWLEWSGAVLGRAEAQLLWGRYHQMAGDEERAREHAERALAYASDPRQPLALIAAHRLLGEMDTNLGRYDNAVEHLQASLELAKRCEAPYEQALTLLSLAELAAARNEIQEASRLLSEARSICEPLGAQRSLERADKIEAELRRHSIDHPAGLSDREVEVLEHAATGQTNAEIGEALYISPRTVAQHLRSVYNKLGVNSRAAAVARWAELNSS